MVSVCGTERGHAKTRTRNGGVLIRTVYRVGGYGGGDTQGRIARRDSTLGLYMLPFQGRNETSFFDKVAINRAKRWGHDSGMAHEGVHQAGEGQKGSGDWRPSGGWRPETGGWRRDGRRRGGEGGAKEVEGVAEVGFFEGAGFKGESQRVWVGGDADGGDFQQFRLKVLSAELG